MIIKLNPKSPFRTDKTIHFTISVGGGDLLLPATPPLLQTLTALHPFLSKNANSFCKKNKKQTDPHLPGPDPTTPVLQCRGSVKLLCPLVQLCQIDPEE